jgi:hypothetical protein
MGEKMIDINSVVLDEYEQDIEDHAEEWVPVSPEEDAETRAILRRGKTSPEPVSITIRLDSHCADRLTSMAKDAHKTPSELAAAIVRRELAYA